MSKIFAAATLYSSFRQEVKEDQLSSTLRKVGPKSKQYRRLNRVPANIFIPLLVSSNTIFTAVTPWVFNEQEIMSARELRFFLNFCPTFKYINHLSIACVTGASFGGVGGPSEELIPQIIKQTARNLRSLSLRDNNEACLTEEVERMLINANVELPYLSSIKLDNSNERKHNHFEKLGMISSRDLEVYLSILKSDSLALTTNGRQLKKMSADALRNALDSEFATRTPNFYDMLTPPAKDRSWATDSAKNCLPLPKCERMNIFVTDYVPVRTVGFDFLFILKHCLLNQRHHDCLLDAYYIALLIHSPWTRKLAPWGESHHLLHEVTDLTLQKCNEVLDFTLSEYPKYSLCDSSSSSSSQRKKLFEVLTIMTESMSHFFSRHMSELVGKYARKDPALVQVLSRFTECILMIFESSSSSTNEKSISYPETDTTVLHLLRFISALCFSVGCGYGSTENDLLAGENLSSDEEERKNRIAALQRLHRSKVFDLLPISFYASCVNLNHSHQKELVDTALGMIDQSFLPPHKRIEECDELLLPLIRQHLPTFHLRASGFHVSGTALEICLTGLDRFFLRPRGEDRPPHDVYSCKKWLSDSKWLVKSCKKFEDAGALEIAFDQVKRWRRGSDCYHVSGFLDIIDNLVFAESLTAEVERVLDLYNNNNDSASADEKQKIAFLEVHFTMDNLFQKKADHNVTSSIIVKIRDKIEHSKLILTAFSHIIESAYHGQIYVDRIYAITRMVWGRQAADEIKNFTRDDLDDYDLNLSPFEVTTANTKVQSSSDSGIEEEEEEAKRKAQQQQSTNARLLARRRTRKNNKSDNVPPVNWSSTFPTSTTKE